MRQTDIVEEMNLLLLGKECCANTVNGRISPSLRKPSVSMIRCSTTSASSHLVVEAALLVEEVEELGVSLTPPEIEVADLEVTPDCTIDCKETMIMTN